MAERTFFLQFEMAPGDVSMLTALVRDLKQAHGERYRVNVGTNFSAIWRHNPYIDKNVKHDDKGVELIKMKYGINYQKRNHVHFITSFYRHFKDKTGVEVPVLTPRADLHLSDEEKTNPMISGRYWIIIPGGKSDITIKWWNQVRYQQVVDRLRPFGLNFVQEGAVKKLCVHPPLDNVFSVVGATSVRDLITNVYHAEGIICGVSFPMHVAGALQRPCVVLGGAREEPWWEEYSNDYNAFGPRCSPVNVPHKYLHTVGQVDCKDYNGRGQHGCWRQRVVALPDRAKHNKLLCRQPIQAEDNHMVAACMNMITTDHVVEAVMTYYEDRYLPPPRWSIATRNLWRQEPMNVRTDQEANWGIPATD